MFERHHQPLASLPVFLRRLLACLGIALFLFLVAIGIGMVGYHGLARLTWIDSFLNASMILTGMGPVDPLPSSSAKLFAGCYAIFSGLVFMTIMGIVLAPVLHRILHRFHLADEDVNSNS